jgi:hypothetical protein
MKAWTICAMACMALAGGQTAFAQPSSSPVFVDGAIMANYDSTDFFDGASAGWAGHGAIGMRAASANGFRFEVDVPAWRVTDTASSNPVYCASASCVQGPGLVPARTTDHTAVRTISYSFLYARHLRAIGRVELAVLGGGSIEQDDRRSSGTFDELAPNGTVLRHSSYSDERANYVPAVVFGVDAEVKLTRHFAVTPQFRFHTFPYPEVSIVRPGIALRWRF